MKRGFTLIELLVVIAIIGIIAAIVVVAVNGARNRGKDAKIKVQVSGAKNSAEIYFNSSGGYGPANVSVVSGGASCAGAMFMDVNSGMAAYADSDNYPGGARLVCVQNSSAFAFAASLSASGEYWCTDSSGNPGKITISDTANVVASDDTCSELDAR
ncbi:MAG: prepilin-type N-terminal cleavage/methylation domain-containing protein [Patescibacteria group bacterium]